jgi:hypothetical protein
MSALTPSQAGRVVARLAAVAATGADRDAAVTRLIEFVSAVAASAPEVEPALVEMGGPRAVIANTVPLAEGVAARVNQELIDELSALDKVSAGADVVGSDPERDILRQASSMALHRLVAEVSEPDLGDAAARLLEYVAASTPELHHTLAEIGARTLIAEARRRALPAEPIAPPTSDEACRYCDQCHLCVTCAPERVVGRYHQCHSGMLAGQ